MYVVNGLADYVDAMKTREIGADLRLAVCRCVFDLMSAAVIGFNDPGAAGLRKTARQSFGPGTAPIWFSGLTSSAMGATMANSAAASALDLDDGNRPARGHAGAAIIPAVFAEAAELGASNEDLLRAIVVGYEVGVSVGAARGFYGNSGTWCGYGVVAASGLLSGTPPDVLAHALAIAGITAPQMLAASGGPTYPMPVGNHIKEGIPSASSSALQAVLMAENGLAGPLDILEHKPFYHCDGLVDGLGKFEHIRHTYFKLYACCRHLHAPVDALMAVMAAHTLTAAEIERVDVGTYSGALRLSNRIAPANLVDAQYSIPYSLGIAATIGPEALLPLTNDVLDRADATAFAGKISLTLDPQIEARFPKETLARLVVHARGQKFESRFVAPRGEASAPLSWAELEDKFRTATRYALAPAQRDDMIAAANAMLAGDFAPLLARLAMPLLAGAK